MQTDEVKSLIEAGIENCQAEIVDLTGTGDHFQATVTTDAFSGKTLVQQHQMVYATVGPNLADGSIHALSIKTRTP